MAQKIAMSFVLQQVLKELGPRISSEEKLKIESQVDSRLVKVLGSDWSKLPATGPRMMALVLILNVVLLPLGIAPALLADIAVKKGKEYGIDRKFVSLLENSKGDFSREKLQEFKAYANKAGSSIGKILEIILSEGKETTKTIVKQGKVIFNGISAKGKTILSKDKKKKKEK